MSVRRCQQEIDSGEFAEWVAFDHLERVGARANHVMLAQIAWLLYHAHRDKSSPKLSIDEFLPNPVPVEPQQRDPRGMWEQLKGYFFGS